MLHVSELGEFSYADRQRLPAYGQPSLQSHYLHPCLPQKSRFSLLANSGVIRGKERKMLFLMDLCHRYHS